MLNLIDGAVGNGRHPDLVLAGHVHNYQRFTRTLSNGWEVPYIVAGGGGYYDLYPVGEYKFGQKTPTPVKAPLHRTNPDRTLAHFVDNYFGYLRITVTPSEIRGVFQPCLSGKGITKYPMNGPTLSTATPVGPFVVDLKKHKVKNG
ncbi:MAG TPA: hypothetical protein VLU94_02155, partial [Candidatus Nitrosotalea sp.]|nr:hypothetical protein [Candidatus Nitrosotalea sp.]